MCVANTVQPAPHFRQVDAPSVAGYHGEAAICRGFGSLVVSGPSQEHGFGGTERGYLGLDLTGALRLREGRVGMEGEASAVVVAALVALLRSRGRE